MFDFAGAGPTARTAGAVAAVEAEVPLAGFEPGGVTPARTAGPHFTPGDHLRRLWHLLGFPEPARGSGIFRTFDFPSIPSAREADSCHGNSHTHHHDQLNPRDAYPSNALTGRDEVPYSQLPKVS